MTYLGNSPEVQTVLRLEARKSFSLGMWIKDNLGHPLDITGVQIRIVARPKLVAADPGDAQNLIINSDAVLEQPGQGYARFNIQASELDHTPGEYLFAIVMVANGYSSVIVEGPLIIDPNTEFSSVDDVYLPSLPPTHMVDIILREAVSISVYAGQALAPGTVSFTIQDKTNLDLLVTEGYNALVNTPDLGSAAFVDVETISLPKGGSPGAALLKTSSADYATHWGQVATGGTGLTATGQPVGAVPTATGAGTWDWVVPVPAVQSVNGMGGTVNLDSDDVPQGVVNKYVSTVQAQKLAALSNPPAYSDLVGLPTLGTAAQRNDSYFHRAGQIVPNTDLPKVNELRGTSRGTAAPSGGADGDSYRQFS